jgi:hypothetical protein
MGSSPDSLEFGFETPFPVRCTFYENRLHVLFRLLTFFVQREFPTIWAQPARQDRGVRKEYRATSLQLFRPQSSYIPRVPQCLSPRRNWDSSTPSPFEVLYFLLDILHTGTFKPPPRSFKYSSVCLIHLMFVPY